MYIEKWDLYRDSSCRIVYKSHKQFSVAYSYHLQSGSRI
jgi:hypothetical protein